MFDLWPQCKCRLAIGGAQFGQIYGMSQKKSPNLDGVKAILTAAKKLNYEIIDTAPSYGISEHLIGSSGLQKEFKIITKLSRINEKLNSSQNENLIRAHLLKSISTLNVQKLYGVLIHQPRDLEVFDRNFFVDFFEKFREEYPETKIGISVYNANDIDNVLKIFTPDIVQLPLNIFDQRLVASGHTQFLAHMGVEIHARSVLLQGAFAKENDALLKWSPAFAKIIAQAKLDASSIGCNLQELSVSFVNSIEGVDKMIVGFRSIEQLKSFQSLRVKKIPLDAVKSFRQNDVMLLDPRNWR